MQGWSVVAGQPHARVECGGWIATEIKAIGGVVPIQNCNTYNTSSNKTSCPRLVSLLNFRLNFRLNFESMF